jgi:hypothetical protein
MRTLTCLSLTLALASCGGGTGDTPDTADTTTPGDTSTGTTADPPATDPTTGTTPSTSGDDVSGTGSSTTGDPPETTHGHTTTTVDPTSTSDDDSGSGTSQGTTTDDTTGGGLGCGFDGPEIDANLLHIADGPPADCGFTLFEGQNIVFSPGPVYELDGCPCGSDCFAPDPWTFTLDVPDGFLPAVMPECPKIYVERQMGKAGCELVSVTIWETANDAMPLPWYVAGSLLGPGDAVQNDLMITQEAVETCECEDCCSSPERYDLTFSGLGALPITLPEDSDGVLEGPDYLYNVNNFQSHLSGICDDSPAIDWIVSLVQGP